MMAKFFLALAAAMALGGCDAAPSQADKVSELASLDSKISALPRSCQSSSDCATAAVGFRACGGPQGFVAFSKGADGGASAQALAARQRALAKDVSKERDAGMASNCMAAIDLGAVCVAQLCELASPGRFRQVPEPADEKR